jgi:hypothetical protein
MDVRTNRATLLSASGGSEGPNVFVNVNATSREIYVVATKRATVKKANGYTRSHAGKPKGKGATPRGTYDQGADRPVFHNLCRYDCVTE